MEVWSEEKCLEDSFSRYFPVSGYPDIETTLVNISIPTFANPTTVQSVNNWILFQQCLDNFNFNLHWSSYKEGFGSNTGSFWLGLEKIYQITNSGQYMLRMEMLVQTGLWANQWISAEYDIFYLESEPALYRIHVTGYSGDSGDVMNLWQLASGSQTVNGMAFTTVDRDNDLASGLNCADNYPGNPARCGWWYNNCAAVSFNGVYGVWGFGVRTPDLAWNTLLISRMMMKQM